ncbi:glycoside hydrolase family 72 protein [Hyaloscypha variabilis F]|uniref:1,3-beta-glucanosyltransferase n=1 Tax=Hyaloscypha variabilis (strain UAMH 11265 / GT02V1 / F) TaxID=1149755 RepID=A0A2J6RR34_HYAVF|nr:glycoside hydrolase family 72 protein [Hyaloscypha variabilis F]
MAIDFSWRILQVVILSCLFSLASSLSTISVVGSKFYDNDGNQFFIKGVVYQPGGAGISYDPLSAEAQCTQDAALMKALGVNLIRVQSVKASSDHSGCMSAFENAGIYVLLDFNSFRSSFDATAPTWTTDQYNDCTAVMDAFASYSNTFGFVAGDELIQNLSESNASSYIKAAIIDLKSYRNSKGYREFPIGHASADVAGLIPFFQDYLACGGESIDFFGLNCFSWCGASSFVESGYNILEANSTGYDIPIFFSETGCTSGGTRTFTDQAAIFGPDMNSQWSGAIIYEWTNESSGFGLVTYGPFAVTTGTPIILPGDYIDLQKEWATLTPTGTPSSLYTITDTTPACPSFTSSGWLLSGDVPLPTLFKAVALPGSTSSASSSLSSPTATTQPDSANTGTGISTATPLNLIPEGLEVGEPPAREMDTSSSNIYEIGSDPSKRTSRNTILAELGSLPIHQHTQILPPSELPADPLTSRGHEGNS